MIEKSALNISELDFASIRDNLKDYLSAQDIFQDFDFEGSGMGVLLDVLAYNTHMQAFYLNMVGNEAFLDSAQLRSSVLSHAKSLCYVPGSSQRALSKINIQITPSNSEDNVSTSVILGKYTRLLGSDIDGVNYPFVTLNSNTATKVSGSFSFSNVSIKQGETTTLQYLMDSTNTKRRFEIPSANVDLTTVAITVQESSSNTDTKLYTLADDITELTANTLSYFIEENENLRYSFYFGDDYLGKKPKNGNIIICTYLDVAGSVANSINKFSFVEPIGGAYSDNVVVTVSQVAYGGTGKETIDQVKFRAPYFYTAQNRAVIDTDYETLIMKDYNYVDAVSVWGGEDNDPVIYGKVFISLKTDGNYVLTVLEKERIKNDLIRNRNVLTVTPEIVDPDYVYLGIKGNITYNPNLTSLTSGELLALVNAAILDYSDDELNTFNSVFRKSKLQKYIENCERSITGSDIDIYVQKRFEIDTSRTKSYTASFNLPLRKSTYSEKLSTFPELNMYDANGILRSVFIEEVPDAQTGIHSIAMTDNGANYTETPTVTVSGDGSGCIASATIQGGRVTSIVVDEPGENYTSAVVAITDGSGSGASATAKLETSVGALRTIYYKTNGEKTVISEIGTIDYSTGKVVLNSLTVESVEDNAFYLDDYLALSAPSENDIISKLRNRIVSIDANDTRSIQLTMVPE